MGNNYDIILIGLVAVFLILRLRSVLGKRTGSERPPTRDPFTPPAPPTAAPRVGDAVNFAAKLEKHNKDEHTRALVDGSTYAKAEQQGYIAPARRERRPGRKVGGVADLVDIVVLA